MTVFNSGNLRINGKEIMLRRKIVILSSQRARGHVNSLFQPWSFLVMIEFFWESNKKKNSFDCGFVLKYYSNQPILRIPNSFRESFEKPALHRSMKTCSSFKLLVPFLPWIKNCMCLLLRHKQRWIWIKFSFRKAFCLSFFIFDETWQLHNLV